VAFAMLVVPSLMLQKSSETFDELTEAAMQDPKNDEEPSVEALTSEDTQSTKVEASSFFELTGNYVPSQMKFITRKYVPVKPLQVTNAGTRIPTLPSLQIAALEHEACPDWDELRKGRSEAPKGPVMTAGGGASAIFTRGALLRGAAAAGLASLSQRALAIPPLTPEILAELEGKRKENVLYTPPSVKSDSTPESIELAQHLGKLDAKMYGAYWCSHCHNQKVAFGATAMKALKYVECAADGYKSERATCGAKGITGFPTWEIQGQFYAGERSLEELANISGFKGWPVAPAAAAEP